MDQAARLGLRRGRIAPDARPRETAPAPLKRYFTLGGKSTRVRHADRLLREVEWRSLPPTPKVFSRHRQLGISRLTESAMGLRDAGDTHDYAAIATPVTWAQVAKAWVRPDPRFAAVSWSRRRGNTLAT